MSKNKKRKRWSSLDRAHPNSSPTYKQMRRHKSSDQRSPSKLHISSSHPPSGSNHDKSQRSDSPSPSSPEAEPRQSYSGALEQRAWTDKRHPATPTPVSAGNKYNRHDGHIQPHQGKRTGTTTSNTHQSRPTRIAAPLDPKTAPYLMHAIIAQNKYRSEHPQTFSSTLPYESDNAIEVPDSARGSIASNSSEKNIPFAQQSESETLSSSSQESSQDRSSSHSSSTTSSTDDEQSSDSDESDDQISSHNRHRPKTKPSKQRSYVSRPMKHGTANTEEMKRKKKKRMERATKRAIQTLTHKPDPSSSSSSSPPPAPPQSPPKQQQQQQPHPSHPSHPPTLTLSNQDIQTLRSLQHLLPPTTLHNALTTLQSHPSSKYTPPSELTTTLTAARTLILQLVRAHLAEEKPHQHHHNHHHKAELATSSTTTTPATAASRQDSETCMLYELVRIARERGQRIKELEAEIETLR